MKSDPAGAVRFLGVSKSWGGKVILENETITLHPGATYVIRGASGIGKTTVLNLIAQYVIPDRGEVIRPGPVGYLF
jgi:ABC-type transporter Mla maintaining outer membrane lipid asymmetry ATPase subunit MlaF